MRMLSPLGIRIFIQRSAVKSSQSVIILGEMCRYPVNDDSDPLCMHVIHKSHEVLGISIAGGRCIVAGHLISPGGVIRMLHNGHQFHVVIPHALHIFGHGKGDLLVIEKLSSILRPLPGAHMNLIDVHGLFVCCLLVSCSHPVFILPCIMQLRYAGCIGRPYFRSKCIRIALHKDLTGLGTDLVFIDLPQKISGDKEFKDAGIIKLSHGITTSVPVIEISDNRNSFRIGRPYGKKRSLHAIHCHGMCTQLLVDPVMLTFIEPADVDGIDHRLKDIGIDICFFMSVFEFCFYLIGKVLCILQHHGEEALHPLGYKSIILLCIQVFDLYDLRVRKIHIDIYIIDTFVHSQYMMGILMTRMYQCIHLHPVDRKYCLSSCHLLYQSFPKTSISRLFLR